MAKPAWIGIPVVVRSNVVRYIRALAILVLVSFMLAVITLVIFWDLPEKRWIVSLQIFVGFSTVVVLMAGWFLSVFFWFRVAVNIIKMQFFRSASAKIWSYNAFYVPFYGWREEDFTEEGLKHRRLAIDGVFGFLLTSALIIIFTLASKAVGLDFVAS